ncbi:MAG: phosphodiester glycosidase family protein [Clostridia bacterium]|nr:phosphodiester glycosidase family protein [Clostridia bacterium]
MREGLKSLFIAILCLLLLPTGHVLADEAEVDAAHLSRSCVYSALGGEGALSRLYDNELETAYVMLENDAIVVSWDGEVAAQQVCLMFRERKAEMTVSFLDEQGETLSSKTYVQGQMGFDFTLPDGAKAFRLDCETGTAIGTLKVFGAGTLPKPFGYGFSDTPEDLDYLLIATHPDDDALFMGAIVPIFGAEQGYTGTILYMTNREGQAWRTVEAHNGCGVMGLDNYPLFANFRDIHQQDAEKYAAEFLREDLVTYLVRLFRQRKPEVVFTHDLEGEYGHWQHIEVAYATLEACQKAADPTYDLESVQEYGTFQVRKCYIHLYPENQITLDTRAALSAFDGLTAFEVARRAYREHVSQQVFGYAVRDGEGPYSIADFGLAYSAEGVTETEVFENAFTPEPTATPTPTPTATPTPTPTASPEPTPAPTVAPVAASVEDDNEGGGMSAYAIAGIALAAAAVVVTAFVVLRKRRKAALALILSFLLLLPPFSAHNTRAEATEDRFSDGEEIVVVDVENGYWEYRNDSLGIFIERHNETILDTYGKEQPVVYYVAHIYMRNYDSFRMGFASKAQNGVTTAAPWVLARREKAVLAITGDNLIQLEQDLKGALIRNGRVYSNYTGADVLAFRDDMTMEIFTRGECRAQDFLEMGIRNTTSFGPWLIEDGVLNEELSKHRLNRTNPRCGVGMIEQGHFVAIVVDGRQSGYSYGMPLSEFRDLFVAEGCTTAYNLDGGCSAGMVFMGEHLNYHDGRVDSADYQRGWPDSLMWGYSELVPSEDEPILNDGNRY